MHTELQRAPVDLYILDFIEHNCVRVNVTQLNIYVGPFGYIGVVDEHTARSTRFDLLGKHPPFDSYSTNETLVRRLRWSPTEVSIKREQLLPLRLLSRRRWVYSLACGMILWHTEEVTFSTFIARWSESSRPNAEQWISSGLLKCPFYIMTADYIDPY